MSCFFCNFIKSFFIIVIKQECNQMSQDLHYYLASGIIESGVQEDHSSECTAEIPVLYHYVASLVIGCFYLFLFKKWNKDLVTRNLAGQIPKLSPNKFEKIAAFFGALSFIGTLYYRILTRKVFFMLNPCHISLLATIYLLLEENNNSMFARKLHTCWTSWLYGAVLALMIPHVEGLSSIQIGLFYYQHLLIVPVGPFILYRRYGMVKPTFKNQWASFMTVACFQVLVLTFVCRYFEINLNFALCHSPADPVYAWFGYHYFVVQSINLNFVSFFCSFLGLQSNSTYL